MKKVKVLALALVIGTASLFAANSISNLPFEKFKTQSLSILYPHVTIENELSTFNGFPDIPVKQIRSQVVELFKNVDFEVESDMLVNITFTFNSEGEIIVLNVDSKNSDILNYIRKNLNRKVLDYPGEMNKVFTIPLKIQKN